MENWRRRGERGSGVEGNLEAKAGERREERGERKKRKESRS